MRSLGEKNIMTHKYRVLILVVLALSAFRIFAAPYSYKCTVKNELRTNDNGNLVNGHQIYIASVFNVDRKSGVVLGDTLGNSSYKTKTVIDPGGEEQYFKLLWLSHPVAGIIGGVNSVYLSIEEFNENYLKPFVLVNGNTVLSGTCE